jgi:chemotaxis response regulator CheB
MTNESSRRALAIALTGMMSDGEIDRARALQIARMVMRETALSVYSLDK